MEYNICNETLVLYALRNKETQHYLGWDTVNGEYRETTLSNCELLSALHTAERIRHEQKHPDKFEIRKMKIIDIGEAQC